MSRFPKLLKTRETKVGNRVAGRTDPELKSVPCQAARYASIARRSNSPRWRGWQCLAGDPVCKGGTMHWQAKKRMQVADDPRRIRAMVRRDRSRACPLHIFTGMMEE